MKSTQLIINDEGRVCVTIQREPCTDSERASGFKFYDSCMELEDQEWGREVLEHQSPETIGKDILKKNHPYEVPEFEFDIKSIGKNSDFTGLPEGNPFDQNQWKQVAVIKPLTTHQTYGTGDNS